MTIRESAGKQTSWPFRAWTALAAVALIELLLFAGYHKDRWYQSLVPTGKAAAVAGEGWFIRSDGLGYYAWLRSPLIDGDWSFDNEFDEFNVIGDWVPPPNCRTERGRRANPWSVGPACVWSVAVVPVHRYLQGRAQFGDGPAANGYTWPYQIAVGVISFAGALLGLAFLYAACRQCAAPVPAALAAGLLTLGTTVVYYGTIEVSMAHGMGTAVTACLAWFWLKTYGSRHRGRWFLVGLLTGLAALMRWQLGSLFLLAAGEGVLAAGRSWSARPRRVPWQPLGNLALAGCGTFLAILPQLAAWQLVFGRWLVTPFPVASNWADPSLIAVLFSTDRSLFYWTPLTLLAAGACLFAIADHRREPLIVLALAFGLQVYVLASLWGEQLYLGAAFGFRQLSEAVVTLAPALALLFQRVPPRWYRYLAGVGCLLVLWNLLLVAMYRYGWLPANGGADPATLVATGLRFAARKRLLLAGQVLAAPVMLWFLLGRKGEGDWSYRLLLPMDGCARGWKRPWRRVEHCVQ